VVYTVPGTAVGVHLWPVPGGLDIFTGDRGCQPTYSLRGVVVSDPRHFIFSDQHHLVDHRL